MSWFAESLTATHPVLVSQPGLQDLQATDRARIRRKDPRSLEGSCNLDAQLRQVCPEEPRWDYAVAYEGRVWFIEVHPADSSGNIDEVVRKSEWLARWAAGPLWARRQGLWWIATGRVTPQPAFARKRRLLAERGVRGPIAQLQLP